MPNRLAHESSPYLLQHADNPVDWHPWGDEAFELARRRDRPIFLSIGYATCHWCHVMAHESFEDPEVASLMNEAFVNVKVDREERPDVDHVYMTVCQLLTGGGGWPLTILMTPDRTPFFAATYLPRSSRLGRLGMTELIPKVQQLWSTERGKLAESARQIAAHLAGTVERDRRGEPSPSLADAAFGELARRFDPERGGFGDRPKFPSPHNLLFLLRYWSRTGEPKALSMVERTLHAMRHGGIWDHVGFGFHRYSTDPDWLVPHFEKMLYDQAMMTLACTEAYQAGGDPRHARTAREIIRYVRRDLAAPEGGFHSAEDADSEGEEGRFYVWTADEISRTLDRDAAELVTAVFNVRPGGNYLDEATRSRTGANILHLTEAVEGGASRLGLDAGDLEPRLEAARERLLEARRSRVRPLKDDKILADWNGLMAAALARAGRVLGDGDAVEAGRRAVEFVLTAMRSPEGRLLHRFRGGAASVAAFLDDHAFVAWACLELYDATLEPVHLERAIDLTETIHELFWDANGGGYFFAGTDAEELLVRPKEVYDGAIPSGNSVAAANLVRLWRLTGRPELAERADAVARAFARDLEAAPSAHSFLIDALQSATAPPLDVVVAGDPAAPATVALLRQLRQRYLPDAALLLAPDGEAGAAIRRLAPFTAGQGPVDGKPAAYVCRDFACELPITDPDRLGNMLDAEARRHGG